MRSAAVPRLADATLPLVCRREEVAVESVFALMDRSHDPMPTVDDEIASGRPEDLWRQRNHDDRVG